ncbi:MAG: hypothetical protein ACREK5_10765 [Gemmatimonadota bacterium]
MVDRRADINFYLCERLGGEWNIVGRYGTESEAKDAARRRYPGQSHFHWKRHDDPPGTYDTVRDGKGIAIVLDAGGITLARERWGPEAGGSTYIPEWSAAARRPETGPNPGPD